MFLRNPEIADELQIPPQTRDVLEEVLRQILGYAVNIRSIKLLSSEEAKATSRWATQGRIAVHKSHDQRVKLK